MLCAVFPDSFVIYFGHDPLYESSIWGKEFFVNYCQEVEVYEHVCVRYGVEIVE